ncbi:hypothetical protein H9L39_18706 [Fusarium oxysporum f. sp. albedinis]|nr:hypothetical protein H9L39_18706 [Fusarium oxysporum f. sp. albedinis]
MSLPENVATTRRTPLACIPWKECIWPSFDDASSSPEAVADRTIRHESTSPAATASFAASARTIDEHGFNVLLDLLFKLPNYRLISQSLHRPSLESTHFRNLSPFLVSAIGSLASISLTSDQVCKDFGVDNALTLSGGFASTAQEFSRRTSDYPSVANVQANLMIAYRELLCSSGIKAWMYGGLAIRMAQALRLGKEYHGSHSALEREIRRRTAWTCFILDRLLSMTSSRVQAIDQSSLGIQLPCPDSHFLFAETYTGPSLHTLTAQDFEQGLLAHIIKSVDLWGNVAQQFICGGRRSSSPPSPLVLGNPCYESSQVISQWWSALPSRFHWSLSAYATHRDLGTSTLYIYNLFILNHALCLALQDYLPLDIPIMPPSSWGSTFHKGSLPGRAGELEGIDEYAISTCLTRAEEMRLIALHLFSGDVTDQNNLMTPFCGVALVNAAAVFLWQAFFASDEALGSSTDENVTASSREKVLQIFQILQSWTNTWKIAEKWCETIELLTMVYAAAIKKPTIDFPLAFRTSTDAAPDDAHPESTLFIGSGVPTLERTTSTLLQKIKYTMFSTSESSELRKEQTENYIESLWRDMQTGGMSNLWSLSMSSGGDHEYSDDCMGLYSLPMDIDIQNLLRPE